MKFANFVSAGRALALVAFTAAATLAQAAPIVYSFTGVASGTHTPTGGAPTAFAGSDLLVTINTDTTNINTTRFGAGIPATDSLVSGTISLSGVGSGTFSSLLYVFVNQGTEVVGFGNLANNDLINITNTAADLDTYGLNTSHAALSGNSPDFFSQFQNVATSFGNVSLSGFRGGVFTAQTGTDPTVPEPQTLALVMGALALMGAQARRSKAK